MIKKECTLPPVRVTTKMMEATKQCAEDKNEYVAEYVRKSVEMRNKKIGGSK